ncbi:MAG: hypothetical protein GY820_28215 [Gammaproteobacteria bacterium]|nr:hypothetical protein [Gammaproteobacteria bacterium]
MNGQFYRNLLQNGLLPDCSALYPDDNWVFMQDSAPSHTAWETRNLLENQCPADYLKAEEWLSNSPDCNPMDCGVWEVFEQKVFDGHSDHLQLWRR